MADLEKILRLVAEGAITPEEADDLLSKLGPPEEFGASGAADAGAEEQGPEPDLPAARRLRIEVHEGGRRVVNVSVPLNIAGLAGGFLPGLSDEIGERIQSAIHSGLRGRIVDVVSDDGDRVLIVSE